MDVPAEKVTETIHHRPDSHDRPQKDGGHGPLGPDGKPLPSPYEMKLAILHKGECSSPRRDTCPCTRSCPLHGRCCDCTRHHIEERSMLWERMDENRRNGTDWLPECLRLAHTGEFK